MSETVQQTRMPFPEVLFRKPCRACGKPLAFVRTASGRAAPMETDERGQPTDVNHFTTCPQAREFSRDRREVKVSEAPPPAAEPAPPEGPLAPVVDKDAPAAQRVELYLAAAERALGDLRRALRDEGLPVLPPQRIRITLNNKRMQDVVHLLQDGTARTPAQLGEALGLSPEYVFDVLRALVAQGLVEQPGRGLYRLVDGAPPPLATVPPVLPKAQAQ